MPARTVTIVESRVNGAELDLTELTAAVHGGVLRAGRSDEWTPGIEFHVDVLPDLWLDRPTPLFRKPCRARLLEGCRAQGCAR